MNIIEKYDRQFAYSGVIMNIALAFQAYMLWTNPSINDANKIYTIAILTAFEFFMIHSGAFMTAFSRKVSLYIFFPLYGLFALVINAMADGNAVLFLYLIVVFQRMRFAFSDVSKGLKNKAVAFSTYAVIIWLFAIGIIMFSKNNLPLNALTEDFLTLSGYRDKHSIGAFTDDPHIAMAFGIIYYLLLALTEFNLTRAFIKHPERFNKMLL